MWTAAGGRRSSRRQPLRVAVREAVEGLPWHHRDPFDRLLVAQAAAVGAPILTADAAVTQYAAEALLV